MKIIAVVVTYNRIEKLKNTLFAYDAIKEGLDTLVIVNNKSTDGTYEYLSEWKVCKSSFNKEVLNLDENLGGSGGFFKGCQYALSLGTDWILVADDDAYPNSDIIEKFESFSNEQNMDSVSAVCSSVMHMDGTIDVGHRKKYIARCGFRPVFAPLSLDNYQKDSFKIDLFSYVGTFLNVEILKKVGLCNSDYFIYYDDTEHSMRMGKYGNIVCLPSIGFSHDDGYGTAKGQTNVIMKWRDYYDIRNKNVTNPFVHNNQNNNSNQGSKFSDTGEFINRNHNRRHNGNDNSSSTNSHNEVEELRKCVCELTKKIDVLQEEIKKLKSKQD